MTDKILQIASRIRESRISAKLSQKELAEKLGITQTRLSNWEVGTSRPLADNIFSLSDALNVSSDYLLGLTDEPRPTYTEAAYGGKLLELPEEERQEIEDYIEFRHQKWLKEHGEN